jgi:hypothetical protein
VRLRPGQGILSPPRPHRGTVERNSWRGFWESCRYGRLLAWTARSRIACDVYASLCGFVEERSDPDRRRAAVDRIQRWLGVDELRASAIFRSTVRSEAREEADVSWLMHHPRELAEAFRIVAGELPPGGPAIWATLHLGSPNLAFVYLRTVLGRDVQIVGRPLDETNPMPDVKRSWGHRKVGWLERVTEAPFLGTSAEAMAVARSRLLQGGSIFVLMDTPGDIVSRSVTLELFGERVRIAAGVLVLARLVGVPIQPVVAISRGARIEMRFGRPIEPGGTVAPTEAVASEMAAILREFPGEWWLWPYLPAAA